LCSKSTSITLVNHITTIGITYHTEKGERLVKLNRLGISVMVFLLVGIFAYANQIQKAEAADSPPLTINANGSITPSTTLITSTDNVTYSLTDNITVTSDMQAINVQRDNIILDGAGYTVQRPDWTGIYLGYRNNVTVKNFKITNCGDGIRLDANTWITIDNCTITGVGRGVFNGYTAGPGNFTFTNNEVRANTDGVNLGGGTSDSLISGNINVTVRDNLITGCRIAGIWPLESGCLNISIYDNTFSNNLGGVWKAGGTDMTLRIYHNYFINNQEPGIAEAATGSNCSWDDGYPSGGNYWSGYNSPDQYSGPYQNETGGDGIGDNPFTIYRSNGKVWDRYPFMFVSICNVSQNPPQGSVFSTDQVSVNATVTHVNALQQVVMNCTYTNSTATWTDSVNMTNLENDIWNGIIPALPVGTNVTYVILAQDNVGNSISSTSQGYTFEYPVVVPEFSTMLILPIFMIVILITIILFKRKCTTSHPQFSRF
jgi:parallel beta-helix repeat protein